MKEYAIRKRYGNSKPFILNSYSTYEEALNSVYIMIKLEKERGRPYFCNIDFFDNDFPFYIGGLYIEIIERNVSNWQIVKFENENKNNIVKIY